MRPLLTCLAALACAACEGPAPAPRVEVAAAEVASDAPTAAAPTPAAVRARLSPQASRAFETLLSARRFTDGAIGEGGDTPREVVALRLLWREPAANDAFLSLAAHATTGGRLYAIAGLYYTDPAAFEREIARWRDSTERIEYQSGCCVLLDQPVSELVAIRDRPVVRLERRDQHVKEWRAASEERGACWIDLAGGGVSDEFRHGGGYAPVRELTLDQGAD